MWSKFAKKFLYFTDLYSSIYCALIFIKMVCVYLYSLNYVFI